MTVCTFTIAQDTSGNREGAGKWLSNSLVQVLLGGGGSLAAAAAVPPPLLPFPKAMIIKIHVLYHFSVK